MTILTWSLRLIILVFLVVFASLNAGPVTLRFLFDRAWELPLVVVLLLSFALGALLGALSLVGVLFRQRRELSRLRRGAPLDRSDVAAS